MKKDIARDVLLAALGYSMPSPFFDEIKRIMDFRIVSTKFVMTMEFFAIDKDTIRFLVKMERNLKNFTANPVTWSPKLHVDEWGFKAANSNIEIFEAGPETDLQTIADRSRGECSDILATGKDIRINPNEEVKYIYQVSEIRRINDQAIFGLRFPVVEPEIRIRKNGVNIRYILEFGKEGQLTEQEHLDEVHTLIGTHFPPAHVRLRWWPVGDST